MNEPNINSELLSADARGRKSIPFAVFAVILIHIILFVVLLIAAGCRAKARAKRNGSRPQEVVTIQTNLPPSAALTVSTNSTPLSKLSEPVIVTEPVIEEEPPKLTPVPVVRPVATVHRVQIYTVQSGDSIAKIARQYGMTIQALKTDNNLKSNIIRIGQKLRVAPEKSRRPKDTLASL